MPTYLSFNPNAKDVVDFAEYVNPATADDLKVHLPLQYTWTVWEQVAEEAAPKNAGPGGNYSDNTKELASFSTVQDFWRVWYHIPQPSELLDKRMVREDNEGKQHVVDAVMIFKEGVKPMWEDKANAEGGHFDFRFRPGAMPASQIDEYWNNIVMGLIGGTLEGAHLITGARLVDKLSNQVHRACCLRIEVWYTKIDSQTELDALWQSVSDCMSWKLDGTQGARVRGDNKSHSGRR